MTQTFEKGDFQISVASEGKGYYISQILGRINSSWRPLLLGDGTGEFATSVVSQNADTFEAAEADGRIILKMTARNVFWQCTETLTLAENGGIVRLQQYIILQSFGGFLNSGFILADTTVKYTYPLQVYDAPVQSLWHIRCDSAWSVPLTAHIWHSGEYIAVYGIDRSVGRGTPECLPLYDGRVRLSSYYPDRTEQTKEMIFYENGKTPESVLFEPGNNINICEFIDIVEITEEKNPLFEAEKLAGKYLLKFTPKQPDPKTITKKLAEYFTDNRLWDENALGENMGWYHNMWIRTQSNRPDIDNKFDLGWGEGYGVLTISALSRHMVRTGTDFRRQIDTMTDNIRLFLRDQAVPGAYFDRCIRGRGSGTANDCLFCDFIGNKHIWTHSLGQIGLQFISLYLDLPTYPQPKTRKIWFDTAREIGDFLLSKQSGGDLQDGFDIDDGECNHKKHRIPARAVVCGLWAKLWEATGQTKYLDAAEALAASAGAEINRYEFYNQMIDASGAAAEIYDSENAGYALQGLVELYLITKEPELLKSCYRCAAYLISWMYFYDLETGYRGKTRGGSTCRMLDYPLVYLGAGCFAYLPLIKLAKATGDDFLAKIGEEILCCIANYQLDSPGKPWHMGIIHAFDQGNGLFWGPDREGQMDTGMTSGISLMILEWILSDKNELSEV